jgi:phosphoribosyl 1,2-cyclic phosphodiesterase
LPKIEIVSIKAIIWGSCGSLPTPASSAMIRGKVKAALWAARNETFESESQVDTFIDTLPHNIKGTYKANTSCVQIETQTRNSKDCNGTEDVILCDAGTGIRDYALSIPPHSPPRTYHIFISHLHWDHIQGFPFFAPAYVPGNRIIFHGFHPETEEALRNQMKAPCFPVPYETMQADIEFDIRSSGDSFQVDDITVTTIKQQHPGDSWGYRFEQNGQSIVYSSDSEHGPEAKNPDYPFIDFFKDANVLIFDGQYTLKEATTEKRNWGHSNHITAVELAARAKVRQLVIFHHEPAYSDNDIEKTHEGTLQYQRSYNQKFNPKGQPFYPNNITIAYDGLIVEAQP